MIVKKIFLFIICFISCTCRLFAEDIAIISSRSIPFFSDTVQGIKDSLPSSINSDIYYADDGTISSFVTAKKYDLICVLGLSAAREVINKVVDTPVVFSLIFDPVKAGILNGRTNVTGVSLNFSAVGQIALAKRIFPLLRNIGIIYSPDTRDFSDALAAIMQVKSFIAQTSTQIPALMGNFTRKDIDVFWLILDSKIYNRDSLSYVLNNTLEKQIPVIGFSSNIAKAGAVVAFSYDYRDIGDQTADVIKKILSGVKPSDIEVSGARKIGYILNLKSAKLMGINISDTLINEADEVYK